MSFNIRHKTECQWVCRNWSSAQALHKLGNWSIPVAKACQISLPLVHLDPPLTGRLLFSATLSQMRFAAVAN